jgi:hypothetical protein
MAYIWILGDSWGDEWGTMTAPECPPDAGFTYQFELQGHKIKTLAVAGKSNEYTLNIAKSALSRGAQPPTHVIQFWTEPLRDLNRELFTGTWRLSELIDSYTKKNLNYAYEVKQLANNPHWAIIGGQAPILKDDAEKLGCSFHIENWRNEILQYEFSHTASNIVGIYDVFEWLPRNKDDISEKNRILEEVKKITKSMFESNQFCDNCHPSWSSYESLSKSLMSWVNKTKLRPTLKQRQKKGA